MVFLHSFISLAALSDYVVVEGDICLSILFLIFFFSLFHTMVLVFGSHVEVFPGHVPRNGSAWPKIMHSELFNR